MTSSHSEPSRQPAGDSLVVAPIVDDGPSAALAELIALARASRRIVALTGAGISTESGIPDYRGPGGVWERQAPPTLGDFRSNPATRRDYWQRRRTGYQELAAADPNAGHLALATLARSGRLTEIITQNIDGLHQKSGTPAELVIELHGTAHTVRCLDCAASWPAAVIQARLDDNAAVPVCDQCGGPLRAATVLFGEPLPAAALRRALAAAAACDLMLVVGTSLIVQPAATLPLLAKQAGARLAIVNQSETPLDAAADVRVAAAAGPTLAAIAAAVVGDGGG